MANRYLIASLFFVEGLHVNSKVLPRDKLEANFASDVGHFAVELLVPLQAVRSGEELSTSHASALFGLLGWRFILNVLLLDHKVLVLLHLLHRQKFSWNYVRLTLLLLNHPVAKNRLLRRFCWRQIKLFNTFLNIFSLKIIQAYIEKK